MGRIGKHDTQSNTQDGTQDDTQGGTLGVPQDKELDDWIKETDPKQSSNLNRRFGRIE